MVAANKKLLKEVQRLAIRDELRAMQLRGRLILPPLVMKPVKKPAKKG
jgi:hypothetical protein